MKISITKNGRRELDRLGFNIETSLETILENIPKSDCKGISEIVFTDFPQDRVSSKRHKSLAAYVGASFNKPAYIEIYLINLFNHIGSKESFKLMLPIQEFGLAKALFHEFGHHVRIIKSHGVSKSKSENFANCYSEKLMRIYLVHNAHKIDMCIQNLENIAKKGKISVAIVQNIKAGWEDYRKGISE